MCEVWALSGQRPCRSSHPACPLAYIPQQGGGGIALLPLATSMVMFYAIKSFCHTDPISGFRQVAGKGDRKLMASHSSHNGLTSQSIH